MRLCITALGPENLLCTIAKGTLRHRYEVAYSVERVAELAAETVSILHRGNRAHKLTEANLEQLRVVGEELARRLLPQPVLTDIRRTMGVLALELDEDLVALPWELLYDGEQFLCRRFDMGRIVNTTQPLKATVTRSKAAAPLNLLVLCSDPTGDLPQVEREGLEIVSELDGSPTMLARLVTGQGVDFVRKELKEYDLVHFAGHVELPDARSGAGWRLGDGVVATPEIADMGAGRPMPFMVFSNGCRSATFTSTESGQKAFGLALAFLISGVRHYIGTQWEVVDGQGALFARHFYTDLGRGATVGAAVRNARNRVIAEAGEGELAWATYVLYGDPELVVIPELTSEQEPTLEAPLRLGVRATAPYKPRGRVPSTGSGPVVARSEPARSGLHNLWMTVAILALVVASALAVVLLMKGSRQRSKEPPAPPPPRQLRTAPAGAPVPARKPFAVALRRDPSSTDPRVSGGLAVLEACLLNHLTEKQGVHVKEEKPGSVPKDTGTGVRPPSPAPPTGAVPRRRTRARYLLKVSGHVVSEQVHLTVKLMDRSTSGVLYTATLPADQRLRERCQDTAVALGNKLSGVASPVPAPPPSPTPAQPSEI